MDGHRVRAHTHARTHTHTHTHTSLTALFPELPRWAGTRKVKPIWILLKQETVSGISWAICNSASRSRQITDKRAATNFDAWWTEAQWVWTVCPRLLPDSVAAAIWTRALQHLSPARQPLGYRATHFRESKKLTAIQSRVRTMRGPAAKLLMSWSSCARSGCSWSCDSSPLTHHNHY